MSSKTTGSCLCTTVQFEINGEFERFFLCHCQYCRKDTGSAHGANLFSSTAKLTWLTGEENVKTYNLPSTRHKKGFCATCGSAMPTFQMDGKLLVVPAGSLDQKISIKPNAHIFVSSRADWDKELEKTPCFEKLPN